jgi:DnaJ-class molecular chaperone
MTPDPPRACRVCAGTGRVPVSVAFAGICPSCWGSGRIRRDSACHECGALPDGPCMAPRFGECRRGEAAR